MVRSVVKPKDFADILSVKNPHINPMYSFGFSKFYCTIKLNFDFKTKKIKFFVTLL